MNKAYIVHYVGADYSDTGNHKDNNYFFELPDQIYSCYEDAVKVFEEVVAEELEEKDLDDYEISRSDDHFYLKHIDSGNWTSIELKCLTIKE